MPTHVHVAHPVYICCAVRQTNVKISARTVEAIPAGRAGGVCRTMTSCSPCVRWCVANAV